MDLLDNDPGLGGSPPPMDDQEPESGSAFEDDAVLVEQATPEEVVTPATPPIELNGDEAHSAEVVDDPLSEGLDNLHVDGGVMGGPSPPTSHSPTFTPVRPNVEPETMRLWREEQRQRLEDKDQAEDQALKDLKEKAQKELSDWYSKYEDTLNQTKNENRATEQNFVAEMNEITPGTEWERVHKLCDFNQKTSRNHKDTSRLRSILLQLKQTPKEIKAH
ncbi:hypothetical protein TCAL_01127 [Tigriopus californicus]|uniref:Clathrin light chain n=1 Tax=Tigriopus californicus TaxID=6832 RepID=A0A553P2V8_TIGCA|nr:clathrin light chain-like [Tigriopus californicus]TRY72035.1 hypothetical protein TCAL_01127 [Tigriopus californicus]